MGVTNTWIAAGPGNWSDDANWSLGHSPIEGEDPTFDGTSVNNCNADDPTPTGVLTIAAGYSGTITQSSDMYISGFSQAGGTFTGSTTKTVYCHGNSLRTGGSFTPGVSNFKMMLDGSTTSNINCRILQISANVSGIIGTRGLLVDIGKTLTLTEDASVYCYLDYYGINNNGIINGNYKLNVFLYDSSSILNTKLGTVITPQLIISTGDVNIDRVFISSSDIVCNALIINSGHTQTNSLDLNGHNLTASSITVGTRGILKNTALTDSTVTATSITVSGTSSLFDETKILFDKTKVVGQTLTWIAGSTTTASNASAWNLLRAPFYNDNIVFDATSVFNCTWDVAIDSLGTFTIAAGYTGTITQSSDMYISGYSQAGGTFSTGSKKCYLSGDLTTTGGNIVYSASYFVFNGHNKTISAAHTLKTVVINDDTIVGSSFSTYNLIVAPGKTLTINSGRTITIQTWDQWANTFDLTNANIAGSGTLRIRLSTFDWTKTLGSMTCNLQLDSGAQNADRKLTLFGSLNLVGLYITSGHTTYVVALDLNGHSLTASTITVGTRGILQCGEGTITTASLDSSAGTITPETAQWIFDGAAKVSAAQKLRSVLVKDRLKLLSNLGIEQALAHTNPVDLNGFALTLDRPDNEYTSIRRPMRRAIRKLDLGPMGALDRWMTDLGGVV